MLNPRCYAEAKAKYVLDRVYVEQVRQSRCVKRVGSMAPKCIDSKTQKLSRLEGAPVPAARDAGGNLGALTQHRSECLPGFFLDVVHMLCGLLGRFLSLDVLCLDQGLDLVETLAARLLPALEGMPAQVTGPRGDAFGVEASILVERDDMGSVRRTEDMTAVAAVMATKEETERGAACGRVTVGRG